jgi:hypothetical protein
MSGKLYQYLAQDHDRLDVLLQRATMNINEINIQIYDEFRKGLLRHISMEEKIVFPAVVRFQSSHLILVARLRLDHGAITALLVPTPSASIIATLQSILAIHNAMEEETGGVYQVFDNLSVSDSPRLLKELQSVPDVRVLPTKPQKDVIAATQRAVARAGYKFKDTTN